MEKNSPGERAGSAGQSGTNLSQLVIEASWEGDIWVKPWGRWVRGMWVPGIRCQPKGTVNRPSVLDRTWSECLADISLPSPICSAPFPAITYLCWVHGPGMAPDPGSHNQKHQSCNHSQWLCWWLPGSDLGSRLSFPLTIITVLYENHGGVFPREHLKRQGRLIWTRVLPPCDGQHVALT